MKKPGAGMIMSGVAHAALLIYAAIGFTEARPFNPHQEALPVEVLTVSEYDQLTKGHQLAKEKAETPKVQAKKIAAVDPKPVPPAPEAKEDVQAPPPAPEPEKVEAPPEPPKPEPEKVETPPEKPAPEKAEAPPPEPTPAPTPKPADLPKPEKKAEKKPEKKAEKKPEKPKPKFDPSKIASLIDKRDPGQKPQEGREISNVTTAGTASGTASSLSLSQQSMIGAMLQEQLYSCFNPPPGLVGRNDIFATVTFEVTEQGVLVGQPRLATNSSDPMFPAFADAAIRAVYNCTQSTRPLRLPVEHYGFWKNPTLDFRPPAS